MKPRVKSRKQRVKMKPKANQKEKKAGERRERKRKHNARGRERTPFKATRAVRLSVTARLRGINISLCICLERCTTRALTNSTAPPLRGLLL